MVDNGRGRIINSTGMNTIRDHIGRPTGLPGRTPVAEAGSLAPGRMIAVAGTGTT